MKKLFILSVTLLYCILLHSQSNILVDLVHGVDYYTDGWGENSIYFGYSFQEFNITYLERSSISLDVEFVNEIQAGNQQLIYNIDLPPQGELESVKTLYVFAECTSPDYYYPTGIILDPQGEIVAEMFMGLIHYDNVYGDGWQVEINLGNGDEYQIIIGYGNVLLDSDQAPGQFDLNNYDCAIRIVDETYFATKGVPNEYSHFDTLAFSEAFNDTLGFLNVYNLQDVYWLKPFVHFDVNDATEIDFEVFFSGNPTLAEPRHEINRGNIRWNNFNAKPRNKNELIYEAAFDSRLNFIYFTIHSDELVIENQTPYQLDNVFIFKYIGNNTYIMSEISTLEANGLQNVSVSEEYTTLGIRNYIKNNFYNTAIDNSLTPEEADHLVNDFIWIESLLQRARNYPSDYFGFYHFKGELYDTIVPYICDPKPETVQRNAWVMLSNIKNREREPIIEFPQEQINDRSIKEGFTLREYGVADEHYTRTIGSRENIFNAELGEYLDYETYGGEPQFYNNQLSDSLSQYIGGLYLGNGEYSFIIDNQTENSILYLYAEPTKPTAVLSNAGMNGKVISFGSAGFYCTEANCCQFINNCANYLVGNDIIQYGIGETQIPQLSYILQDNYPNPSNPSTKISFSILQNSDVTLTVYNLKGQKVKTLTDDRYTKGDYSVVWDGCDDSGKTVSPSVYFYKLATNGELVAVKKCIILR